jgi:hypothetical protein
MASIPPAPFPPPQGTAPARSDPPPRRDRRRRRRGPVVVAIVASVGIVAIVATLAVDASNGRTSAPTARSPAPTPQGPGATATSVDLPGYPVTWSRYTAPDGSFTVVGPGDAAEESSGRDRGVERHRIAFEPSLVGAYTVDYFDYPKQVQAIDDLVLLRGQIRSTIRDAGERVVDQEPLDLAGFPGARLRYRNGQGHVILDLYVIQGRLYQLGVGLVGDPSDFALERARLFLESFQPFPQG